MRVGGFVVSGGASFAAAETQTDPDTCSTRNGGFSSSGYQGQLNKKPPLGVAEPPLGAALLFAPLSR